MRGAVIPYQSSRAGSNPKANRRLKRGRVVIGIDLGTTFSSVVYIVLDSTKLNLSRSMSEQVRWIDVMVDNWPASGGSVEAVPTESLYADLLNGWDSRKWFGFEVNDACENREDSEVPVTAQRIRLAKLLLHEAQETKHETDILRSLAAATGKDPLDFVKEYLEYLNKCIMHYFETHHPDLLETSNIEYVFGCPPAWSMHEHRKMSDIAKKAGMSPKFMGSEAEALLAVHLANDGIYPYQVGDKITICDGGGGTVDLVTVMIKKLEPLEVEQTCVSEGATCGGIYIDIRMRELFERKLAPENLDGFEDVIDGLMKMFVSVKKNFGPAAVKEGKRSFFAVRGLRDDVERGFEKGRVYISCEEMMEVFDPSVNELVRKVIRQIQMSTSVGEPIDIKTIALGGGFGSSKYVYDRLQSALAKLGHGAEKFRLQVLKNCDGANVAKGLVLLASNPTMIKQRRSRANYGLLTYEAYDEKKHGSVEETEPEVITIHGDTPVVELIDWFLVKGQAINENFTIKRKDREIGVLPGYSAIADELYMYDGDLSENLVDKKYTLRRDLPEGVVVCRIEASIEEISIDEKKMDEIFVKKFSHPQDSPPQPYYSITYDFIAKHKSGESDWIACSLSLKSRYGGPLQTPTTKMKLHLDATEGEDDEEVILGSLVSRGEIGEHIPISDFDHQPLFLDRKRRRNDELVGEDETGEVGNPGKTVRKKFGRARRGRGKF